MKCAMSNTKSIDELITLHREYAKGTSDPDPKKANRCAKQLAKYYEESSTTKEGQSAIQSFISDPNPHIRCWASAHSLKWYPKLALASLEELAESDGSCSFDARIIVDEYKKGRLSLDN